MLSLDIATDARWHPSWRELCLSHGLHACQSTPIVASDGTPLGSFLLSFGEPKTAAAWDPRLIGIGVHPASLILEREAKDQALHEALRQKDNALSLLEALIGHAPIGIAFFDQGHRYVRINNFLTDNYAGISKEHVGRPLSDVSSVAAPMLAPHIDKVLRMGAIVSGLEMVCDLSREPGRKGHWLVSLYPVQRDRETVWIGAVMIDITQRKLDKENRKLLLAELSHRVKNTLAVVQAIVTLTMRGKAPPEFSPRRFSAVSRRWRTPIRCCRRLIGRARRSTRSSVPSLRPSWAATCHAWPPMGLP